MTAEQAIAAQLEGQVGSLAPGRRHLIRLEQVVSDGFGGWRNGPHPIGWIEQTSDGVRIRLVSTEAAATARALLEEDLLDVVLSDSYPPVIRLTVLPTSALT